MSGIVVGQIYKHFKGGIYKVVGLHWMQHHWDAVHGGQEVLVVRYVRVMDAAGRWENRGEEWLRPVEDWQAEVEWPHGGRAQRFLPIAMALDLEEKAGAAKI